MSHSETRAGTLLAMRRSVMLSVRPDQAEHEDGVESGGELRTSQTEKLY
jgi:hypothetical protein